jgi:mycothiol synthase
MTETTWLDLPAAPAIDGLRVRRYRDDTDNEAMAAMMRAANIADGIPWIPTADHLRLELGTSDGIDRALDLLIVELDGVVMANAGVERVLRDGRPMYQLFGHVHPDLRRRGIGRMLLDANLARARSRAAADADDGPIEAAVGAEDGEAGATALFDAAGFAVVRHFFLMRRPSLDTIPEVALPAGLELRTVVAADHRVIFDAEVEAFRDHWGALELGDDSFRQTFATPEIDTDLWAVAWDGDEVAGVVQTWIWTEENEALGVRRGWLERVSVRRPWRRRGLAKALIARSLTRLRDAGMDDAMLGVDSESPTGALGLYEGLGFEVHSRSAAYRLTIRD